MKACIRLLSYVQLATWAYFNKLGLYQGIAELDRVAGLPVQCRLRAWKPPAVEHPWLQINSSTPSQPPIRKSFCPVFQAWISLFYLLVLATSWSTKEENSTSSSLGHPFNQPLTKHSLSDLACKILPILACSSRQLFNCSTPSEIVGLHKRFGTANPLVSSAHSCWKHWAPLPHLGFEWSSFPRLHCITKEAFAPPGRKFGWQPWIFPVLAVLKFPDRFYSASVRRGL